jgi:hypothetical protein
MGGPNAADDIDAVGADPSAWLGESAAPFSAPPPASERRGPSRVAVALALVILIVAAVVPAA